MTALSEPNASTNSRPEQEPYPDHQPGAGHRLPPAPAGRIHPDRSRSWLRRALPLVLAHKVTFTLAVTGTLIGLALQMAIPRVTMAAIDQALVHKRHPLLPYVLALVALGLAQAWVAYSSRLSLFRIAYGIEYDLRTMIFEQLTRLSPAFYDRVQSGQVISRANSDIRAVQRFLAFGPNIAIQIVGFFVAFAIMLTINVPLALLVVATMPLVYLASARMRGQLFPLSWVVQARLAEVATIVDENIGGVRVVKSFAAEQAQLAALVRAAKRVEWANVRQISVRARWAPLIENLPRASLALVLLVGGIMAIHGQVSVGALVAFNSYVLLLQAPFRMLGMLLMLGQRAAASAQRVFALLDERPDVRERPGATSLVDPAGDVRLEDVHFRYAGGPPVLRGASLHIRPGETVALVGRTGSGKSTLAKLLLRFYDVDDGRVLLDGHDIRDLTLDSVRRTVGVVPDEPFLFSVSLRDNIAYARPGASQEEVVAAARAAGADEFIQALPDGYDTVVGERGYTLSGGQRQRIAIARALLADRPVLILDDATSAVDVEVERQIHGALRRLAAGRATLIIAHRLATLALADRVAFLDEGRIVAEGSHAELLATVPAYAEVLAQAERRDEERRPDGGRQGSGSRGEDGDRRRGDRPGMRADRRPDERPNGRAGARPRTAQRAPADAWDGAGGAEGEVTR